MKSAHWQRLETLYEAALELDTAAARAEFLERECRDDPALQREVASLLAAHDEAGNFLAQPALNLTAALSGQQINHYRVLELLGKGGMGEVYLAEDARLKRRVALKLLPAQFSHDPERVRRFEREARAVSLLNHPHIITIHEIGQTPADLGGAHFLVTEFVEGQTLRQLLNERRTLPPGEALPLVTQIAEALAAAHAAGVVHRDIKPENVMVRRDGHIKVLDFGLAKVTETQAGADSAEFSEAGKVLGTISYMSPEQARGQNVDERTDIFSLGVVLFELLSGQLPFAGATPSDRLAALLRAEPPPFSDVAPETPSAVEKTVLRALAKEADERWATMTAFAAALQTQTQELEFRQHLAAAAPSATKSAKGLFKLTARRPVLAVLVFLVLCVLAGAVWRQMGQRESANAAVQRLNTNGRRFWNQRTLEGFRQGLTCFEQALALDPNSAPAWAGVADSWSLLAEYDFAPPHESYPKAKAAALRALALNPKQAEAHATLATIKAYYEWDWPGAESSFQQALAWRPDYASAHQWYAEFLVGQRRFQEARREIQRALALAPAERIIQATEVRILVDARDYDAAIARCRQMFEQDPDFAEVYAYLGLAYERKGMYREAMDAYERRGILMGDNTPTASALRTTPVRDARDYWQKRAKLEEVKLYGSPFDKAEAVAQLGETEQALTLLEQSCQQGNARVAFLNISPHYDSLRSHPRFQQLLRRVRLDK